MFIVIVVRIAFVAAISCICIQCVESIILVAAAQGIKSKTFSSTYGCKTELLLLLPLVTLDGTQ